MSNLPRRIKFEISYLFGNAPWDSGISPPELYDFIATHAAGRALDIGCGTGTNIITLSNAGWNVSGFDFSPGAIRIAKRKARDAKVDADIFIDDATKMKNVRGVFDLALDLGCFHGITNKADYLTHLTRILAPNGFWLLYGFFKSLPSTGSGQAALSGHIDRLSAAPGLVDSDIDLIQRHNLTLVSRKDGWDKQERPSAWFLWQAG